MKQFFSLAVLFALFTTAGIQAQDCTYSKSAQTRACPHPTTAVKAATLDASIEKRFDEATGETTFVRKEVCAASGKVKYTPVEYCSKSGKFVNISPREKQCVKSKQDCRSKGARATKVSGPGKIRCTAAQKAACAKAKAGSGAAAEAKLVKQ